MLRLSSAFALVTLVACASEPAGSSQIAPGGGKADGAITTLSFDGDYSESVDGRITAGATIRVAYDLDRVTECRGSTNGSDVWGATGYASFDGRAPVEFAVSRITNGTTKAVAADLDVPADAESVELWFTSNNRWGCLAYDSNEGANYTFEVAPQEGAAVVSFDADDTYSLDGDLVEGGKLVIHYDPSRLSECAGSSGGAAQWSVTGYYQVDGGAVKQLLVTRADGPDLVAADPWISVPRGETLSLWFDATNRWGCHAYDSNFGANYSFTIE